MTDDVNSGSTAPEKLGADFYGPASIVANYGRNLPASAAFEWLKAGARDTLISPLSSLLYGLAVFAASLALITALITFGFSYILLPSIAGFLVVGPVLAVGLYQKSRLIAHGAREVSVRDMLRADVPSHAHLLFVGVILGLVMLFWLRTAILLYALFFGLHSFESIGDMLTTVFTTQTGLSLLAVGTVVGGMLAAFAFSVSAFSIPMLLKERRKDTITAMTVSVVMAWCNPRPVFLWGLIVLSLFLISAATAFVGLIVIFPVLGHATWHAYKAVRNEDLMREAEAAP